MHNADEVIRLAHQFGELVLRGGLGPRSLFHLQVGVEAAASEGVGGVLVVRIPSKPKERVEFTYRGDLSDLRGTAA